MTYVNCSFDYYEQIKSEKCPVSFYCPVCCRQAKESSIDETIFMHVHGVKLASSDASDIAFNSENLHVKIKSFTDIGGTVLACPMCMKIHGVDASSLAPGIQVSGSGIMMEIIKSNPTVFTY